MRVIVDSCVWSLALRRNTPVNEMGVIHQLRDLVQTRKVILLGAIRQEVLSGIRYVEQFNRLRDYLRAFPNVMVTVEDYELAAEFSNTCRRQGVQGSNTDFLICAVAHNRGYQILTTDQDFKYFSSYISIDLI